MKHGAKVIPRYEELAQQSTAKHSKRAQPTSTTSNPIKQPEKQAHTAFYIASKPASSKPASKPTSQEASNKRASMPASQQASRHRKGADCRGLSPLSTCYIHVTIQTKFRYTLTIAALLLQHRLLLLFRQLLLPLVPQAVHKGTAHRRCLEGFALVQLQHQGVIASACKNRLRSLATREVFAYA